MKNILFVLIFFFGSISSLNAQESPANSTIHDSVIEPIIHDSVATKDSAKPQNLSTYVRDARMRRTAERIARKNLRNADTTRLSGHHEIKAELFAPFYGAIRIDYEYVPKMQFSWGISACYSFVKLPKNFASDGRRHYVLGYFRAYFNEENTQKYPASGWYANVVNIGYYKGFEHTHGTFALTQDIGWKSRRRINGLLSVEFYFGWGWAFYLDDMVTLNEDSEDGGTVLPNMLRAGICVGMQLGKKR